MPAEFSFDVVSVVDLNAVSDCVNVAIKEISNRFDFKGSPVSIEWKPKEKTAVILAADEFKVKAVWDILAARLAKRSLPLKNFNPGKIETALGQQARMAVSVQSGIPSDKAKEISKAVRDSGLKVSAQIQGEQMRIAGRSKDDLQAAIARLKAADFGVALQFINYR